MKKAPHGSRCRAPSCKKLEALLNERNSHPDRRRQIDRLILKRFRSTKAVLVLDMAGFSVSVQRDGIIHHLARIYRMHDAARVEVEAQAGTVVKFEADNCFATFYSVRDAIEAAITLNAKLAAINTMLLANDRIHVSIGIGYGQILLACDDLFGDEVNLTAKLGEDIAERGEVLLTERARKAVRGKTYRFSKRTIKASGIAIQVAKLVI